MGPRCSLARPAASAAGHVASAGTELLHQGSSSITSGKFASGAPLCDAARPTGVRRPMAPPRKDLHASTISRRLWPLAPIRPILTHVRAGHRRVGQPGPVLRTDSGQVNRRSSSSTSAWGGALVGSGQSLQLGAAACSSRLRPCRARRGRCGSAAGERLPPPAAPPPFGGEPAEHRAEGVWALG